MLVITTGSVSHNHWAVNRNAKHESLVQYKKNKKHNIEKKNGREPLDRVNTDIGPCDCRICSDRHSHSHWTTNLSIELKNTHSDLFKKSKITKIGSETAENEPIENQWKTGQIVGKMVIFLQKNNISRST